MLPKSDLKEISQSNWLEPEPIMQAFVTFDDSGEPKLLNGKDWLSRILTHALGDKVPEKIQTMFEVARGAMAYSYFYYPLWVLGAEQLFRVADAALEVKANEVRVPKTCRLFKHRVEWFRTAGLFEQWEADLWDSLRWLRNRSSHPTNQNIYTPAMALGVLEEVAQLVNRLFEDEHPRMPSGEQ